MVDLAQLEQLTDELLHLYEVQTAPVPIEQMLQQPRDNMWGDLDISNLSSTFIKVGDAYGPRMSLARMLARHIIASPFGAQRGLSELMRDKDEPRVLAFARMLVMPRSMVMALSAAARTPEQMSAYFEVPTDEAAQRLSELV